MDILKKIQTVRGPDSYQNEIDWNHLTRRVLKLSEEEGELAQAYLDYTSDEPHRGKTIEDLVEEAVDTAIVSLDIALVISYGDREKVNAMILKKIQKWKDKTKPKPKKNLLVEASLDEIFG